MLEIVVNVLVMVAIPVIASIVIPRPLPPASWLLVSLFWIVIFIVIPLLDRTTNVTMIISSAIGSVVSYFAMKFIAAKKSKR